MSSDSSNNNNTTVDNKTLQQQQNGAVATPQQQHQNDNKAASRVALSSVYSPSPIPSTTQSVAYAVAKLKAAALGGATTSTKRNIHLSIACDVSGSMQGDRIETARESLRFIIEQLRPTDSLAIVAFSNNATTVLPLTNMSPTGKASALRSVNSLRASGSTNLSGGMVTAHNLVCPPTIRSIYPTGIHPSMINMPPHFHINQPVMPPPYGILTPPMPMPTPTTPLLPPIVVQVSHEYNGGSGNNPNEKCQYKLKIVAPEDKISKFTIHDPENRFADVLGSGETELDLKPLPAPIQQLEISFDIIGASAPHKMTYFVGEVPSGKKNASIPAPNSANNNNNNNNDKTKTTDSNAKTDDNILRAVMVFTDGHANLGETTTDGMVALTNSLITNSPYDSTIFTFGFGDNHNAQMLQAVASATEGMFYYIENTKVLAEIFADCLGGLFSTVAQNVKVTARLTAGHGIRFGTAMTKYKTQIEDNGNTLVISMKDLYAEEERDILLELKVDGPTAKSAAVDSTTGGVGIEWTLEFVDAVANDANNKTTATANTNNKVILKNVCVFDVRSDAPAVVNNEVDGQVQRYNAIQVMNQVREAADQGRLEEARRMANSYNLQLQAAPSAAMASNQMLQQQMCNLEALAKDSNAWATRGSKQSVAYAQSHAFQRGNAVSEDCAYAPNEMKMQMRSKAKKGPE